jgi:predicted nucleotidyltransferase
MSASLTKEDIISVLRQQKDFLRKNFYVKTIGIFGSFARNEANESSDIDFLVEIEAPLEIYIANRYALTDYLKKLFSRKVDIANPNSLKPHYKQRILKRTVYA